MEYRKVQSVSRRSFAGSTLLAGAGLLFARPGTAQAPGPSTPPSKAPTAPSPQKPGEKPVPKAAKPSAPAEVSAKAVPATIALPALPYPESALEPAISATTVAFHYGKHHKAYIEKTNSLSADTHLAGKSLEEIVKGSAKNKKFQKLFNNSAQAWNHNFYWQSMKPKGGGAPSGAVKERMDKDFGSYENFRDQFIQVAVDHFSNGWVWLVLEKNKLKILDTHDADTPLVKPGMKPLLTTDLWEHAYYLDYKNLRKDYVTKYLDTLLNWDFVAANLG